MKKDDSRLPKATVASNLQNLFFFLVNYIDCHINLKVTYNTHITGAKHKKKEKNKQMMSERGLEVTGVNDSQSLAPPKAKKSKKAAIDFRVSKICILFFFIEL